MVLSSTAQHLLASYDQVSQVTPDQIPDDLTVEAAATIVDEIRQARQNRGEKPVGYKIGFTNRTIWARYGVHHPIWGPIYDTTLTMLDGSDAGNINPTDFTEPRLEPEIVVCLRHSPLDASVDAVSDAVAWVAHGFEIVQSVYPGWQFTGAQSFAAQALHGSLLVGPRIDAADLAQGRPLAKVLSGLHLSLYKNGAKEPVDQGQGANVLDGPIQALAHLVQAKLDQGETLQTGSIITTGTITDAQVLVAGDRWQSQLDNIDGLSGLNLAVGHG
ncbi:MAG: 2-keto-4-pentenoate hydratase [Burkholderiaceae bacterium]